LPDVLLLFVLFPSLFPVNTYFLTIISPWFSGAAVFVPGYGTTVALRRLLFLPVAGTKQIASTKGEENMRRKITAVLSALFLAALTLTLAVAAQASPLLLNGTGSLDGATVLTTPGGSAPLGADTSFSYHATFESTGGTYMGGYLYSATTTFDLSGRGTYTSSSLSVLLADPTSPLSFLTNYYTAGLMAANGDGMAGQYSTASPTFFMGTPTPSLLSNPSLPPDLVGGTINFDGEVSLSNLTWGSANPTAELTAANTVPEPSTYALLCISLGVVGYARKRMVSKNCEG
jgi:PEP-CTERM motif